MWVANLGRQIMLCESRLSPRHEIAAIGLVIDVLKLASAAFREVPAGRLLMMRPEGKCAVVQDCIAGDAERNVAAA